MKSYPLTRENLLQVLLAPLITEKATYIADKYQQVAFKVRRNATKLEIKSAVELLFSVEVHGLSVINVAGKEKRVKGRVGHQKNWKKAYVKLKHGQEIDFSATNLGGN